MASADDLTHVHTDYGVAQLRRFYDDGLHVASWVPTGVFIRPVPDGTIHGGSTDFCSDGKDCHDRRYCTSRRHRVSRVLRGGPEYRYPKKQSLVAENISRRTPRTKLV